MVKVKMLKSRCLGDGVNAMAGEVVEVQETQARILLAQGVGELVSVKVDAEVRHADPVAEHRDPQPRRKRG